MEGRDIGLHAIVIQSHRFRVACPLAQAVHSKAALRCIMATNRLDSDAPKSDIKPLEEPLAELERQLIAEYLAPLGQNLHTLLARDDKEARTILAEASRYA